ncbi:MAG TPA: polysaccharide deacetylase [Baekduia sp.]|nr:polysaccharide deacetylase [Baekduia sp.]
MEPDPPRAATDHWRRWAQTRIDYGWPGGKDAAVCLTFDVDAETGPYSLGEEYHRRLSTVSDARFSTVRGVWRILEILERQGVPATFFVPGWTAENYPHVVEAILAAGHEVGHHGYLHSSTHKVDMETQERELDRGFAALESVGAPRPRGYRSTAWEVTPETLQMVVDRGFLYDSSFMSDDRPYIERHDALEVLELPSHWSLDDYPYFGYMLDYGGNTAAAGAWRENWWSEYENARDERRSIVFTCHPEVSGRAYRTRELERLIEQIGTDGRAWFARMEDVARHVEPKLRSAPV